MSLYETLDLIASQFQVINETWNFFVTIHLAVLGLIFIAGRKITWGERIIGFVGYCGFSAVNYSAQRDNYAYLETLISEAAAMRPDADGVGSAAIAHYQQFDLAGRIGFLPLAYLTAGALTIVLLLLINWFSRGVELER